MLANPSGHDLIADMLISYFQSQICAGWAATMGHAFDVPYMGSTSPALEVDATAKSGSEAGAGSASSDEASSNLITHPAMHVPQALLTDRPSDILRFREVQPFCVSANDLINPLPPSHFFGSGWLAHHPGKGASTESKHYWYSEIGGSRIRVPVNLSAGDVGVYYLQ